MWRACKIRGLEKVQVYTWCASLFSWLSVMLKTSESLLECRSIFPPIKDNAIVCIYNHCLFECMNPMNKEVLISVMLFSECGISPNFLSLEIIKWKELINRRKYLKINQKWLIFSTHSSISMLESSHLKTSFSTMKNWPSDVWMILRAVLEASVPGHQMLCILQIKCQFAIQWSVFGWNKLGGIVK